MASLALTSAGALSGCFLFGYEGDARRGSRDASTGVPPLQADGGSSPTTDASFALTRDAGDTEEGANDSGRTPTPNPGGDAAIDAGSDPTDCPSGQCPTCGGGPCALQCGDADACTGRCNTGSDCELACGGANMCSVECATGARCAVDCVESSANIVECGATCAAGSSCGVRCAGGECAVHCQAGSACEVVCQGANCAGIVCEFGASCLLICEADECNFAACPGGLTSCDDGSLACGTGCPDSASSWPWSSDDDS